MKSGTLNGDRSRPAWSDQIQNTRSTSRYGSCRRRTPYTTVKIAVVAPTVNATVSIAPMANAGVLRSARAPKRTSRRRLDTSIVAATMCRRRGRGEDLVDLAPGIDVVPRRHADDVLDRFGSALGMHPMVLPLLGLERLEEREVPVPQHAELLDRFVAVALVVVSAGDPSILVVRGDGDAGGAEDR